MVDWVLWFAQVVGANCPKKVLNMALPDAPVITGNSQEVFDYYGLNAEGIAEEGCGSSEI